jgi:hypothetical protein
MSSHPVRFNRSLFTAPLNGGPADAFIDHLASEDIELVIDLRRSRSSRLDDLCASTLMYYVCRDDLDDDGLKWAARLALRHRACVVADPGDERVRTSQTIAKLAGMRLIDIEASPAPIASGHFRPLP